MGTGAVARGHTQKCMYRHLEKRSHKQSLSACGTYSPPVMRNDVLPVYNGVLHIFFQFVCVKKSRKRCSLDAEVCAFLIFSLSSSVQHSSVATGCLASRGTRGPHCPRCASLVPNPLPPSALGTQYMPPMHPAHAQLWGAGGAKLIRSQGGRGV